jgi:hypothetical protein
VHRAHSHPGQWRYRVRARSMKKGLTRERQDHHANHKTSTVTDIHDRHVEDKRIMAAVARHVLGIVEETGISTVVSLR